ncbi:MAG TPA: glycosyltransferase family 2 protein [Silvibacterium sp.]|nr:glycosyltransferase family 2 protein [Silvibacterium sp.]
MNSKTVISVILPVRNESASLPALLASLAQQDFPPQNFEIILADSRSTDNTRDIVQHFVSESFVSVKLVDNPGIRSGPGRNAGIRAASGEFVLFIDGHCVIPSPNLLRDTVSLFQQTQADCLCRPQPLIAPSGSAFGSAVAAVRASLLGHGRDSLIYAMDYSGFVDPASSGAAYRRSVFDTIGVYDERFDACEDVELNTRFHKEGLKAYTDPRLAVFYQPRTTLSSFTRQMIRYGRGRLRLMLKHPDCISAGQLAPAILVIWIVVATLAMFFVPELSWLRWAFVTPVVFYVAAVLLSSIHLARKSGASLLYMAPIIYCAIHLGLGFGILAEGIQHARSLLAGNFPRKAIEVPECNRVQER